MILTTNLQLPVYNDIDNDAYDLSKENIGKQNIDNMLCLRPLTGMTTPIGSSTIKPRYVGDKYIDTVAKKEYTGFIVGDSTASSWIILN